MDESAQYPATTSSPSAASSSLPDSATDNQSLLSEQQLRQGLGGSQVNIDDQLQKLRLIPAHEAWEFDIPEFLDSPTFIPPEKEGQESGNNFKNYDAKRSIFVLCVLGTLDVHLHLLCAILPYLQTLSPNLQPLVITDSTPHYSTKLSPTLTISLPAVEARGTPPNHFLKLGLLRPTIANDDDYDDDDENGSRINSRAPLDALVVVDPDGKRRLVLPFGWGAGRFVMDRGRGRRDVRRLGEVLERVVRELEEEKGKARDADFYEIAKTYF